jgi:hypothetical protein
LWILADRFLVDRCRSLRILVDRFLLRIKRAQAGESEPSITILDAEEPVPPGLAEMLTSHLVTNSPAEESSRRVCLAADLGRFNHGLEQLRLVQEIREALDTGITPGDQRFEVRTIENNILGQDS